MDSSEREGVVDIEAGISEGVECPGSILDVKPKKTVLSNVCESYKGENGSEILPPKKIEKEKRKSTSAKKPPKPPRPPRGYSLDAADRKLIKELHELAMMKRARVERMKALKKMKAAKASSSVPLGSNGSFFAMFFTVLFFLVLIFQGMSSGNSSTSFHGSPESGVARESSLVNPSSSPSSSTTGSGSPIVVEQSSGNDPEYRAKMAIG